jgi:hypothetical protein
VVCLIGLFVGRAPFAPLGAQSSSEDPFVRYVTPGQCVQAAERLQRLYWRDKRPDTVVFAPATDSVPAPVAQALRRCVDRFSVQTVVPADLRNLATVYLWTGQDSLAQRAMDRLAVTSRAQSARDRGWELWLWASTLLAIRPTRTSMARQVLAQLDALGAPAALWRVFAHRQYADYAWSVNDRATSEAEGRLGIAATHQLSTAERIDWYNHVEGAYLSAAVPLALRQGGTAALALLDTMTADVAPLRPAGSPDQRRLVASLAEDRVLFESLGRRDLHVHADAWYGANGDTIRPRPGRLSLVLFMYGPSYETFATVRRLHALYGAKGLDIIFLTSTSGAFRELPMPNPRVEADSMGQYTLHFLGLPGTVAAEWTPFSYIADGRRRNDETPNQRVFGHLGGSVLIDRSGVVRWIDSVQPSSEAVWTAVIRDAL